MWLAMLLLPEICLPPTLGQHSSHSGIVHQSSADLPHKL